ncbi:hypothetical protein [Streptomyces flavalbus]|uniref:Cytochrome C oxidase subunit I n=1 Tax=Streptomyces flavalbus TaxID=2665155 RepID=A0ABW2WG62_9ACTN
MRRKAPTEAPQTPGNALVRETEGYLRARSHHEQAVREAEELCARLSWLTTTQAQDLTEHYVRQRVDLTRRMLRRTVQRAAEIQREYEARYATLRRSLLRRHAACACVVLACATGASALAGCLLR